MSSGCPNCIRLEGLCREVVDEKGIEAKIEKITDFNEFGKYGIMMTPGLVVKGARKYKGCQADSITDNLPLTK